MSSKESINLSETVPGLVSVLIPAYNHEQYVQLTIRSIIEQTYQNIELIVIDDGSKDSTWEKINELKSECEKRFCRVDFSTQENSGTCITLNRLIEKARGEYIYLIASDDLSMPEAIQKEFEFLSNHDDYALAVGDNYIIDEYGNRVALDNKMKNVPLDAKDSFQTFAAFLEHCNKIDLNSELFGTFNSLWKSNHIPNGYLIRKSIFRIIGGFTPNAPLEDYYLMLKLSKVSKLKFINQPLFYYRRHSGCTSKKRLHMLEMTIKTKWFLLKGNYSPINICRRIYYLYLHLKIYLCRLFFKCDIK